MQAKGEMKMCKEWVCSNCGGEFLEEMVCFEITTDPDDAPDDCNFFKLRAEEKADSRRKDQEDLDSGKKTREQLRKENAAFNFPNVKLDLTGKLS